MGELISRSEQDLLDIRNFGAKSIDEVKAKLVEMGLSLKDSAPGFDPQAALAAYADDDDDSFVERAVLIHAGHGRRTQPLYPGTWYGPEK